MNKWLKLMIPDGEPTGGSSAPSAPSTPASNDSAPSTPSAGESLSETPSAPVERVSPITADVAEKLGVSVARPIEVKPLAALGLDKAPRTALNDILAKDAAKISKNIPFEKKPVAPSGGPAATPAASMEKPAEAPAVQPPAPAVPVTPPVNAPGQVAKYKVGDTEYTPEQMQAYMAEARARAEARMHQQQFQPQQPLAPQQPQAPVNQLTPEQQRIADRQRTAQWVNETAPHIDLEGVGLKLTPEQADIISAGGAPAAQLVSDLQARSVAYATLTARRTMAMELNPILQGLRQQSEQQAAQAQQLVAPLIRQAQEVQAYETEQAFTQEYPDLAPHIETARIIGHELVKAYPDWARQVTRKDFCAEVAKRTPQVLQRFGVKIEPKKTPVQQTNAAPTGTQAPKNANGVVPKAPTGNGPKPITGQAPGKKPVTPQVPPQSRQQFTKVAVDSIAALR